ncbi:MAG: LysM peptidoglycan-binding domain-containing protein [Desulfatibacillaceae bacterium]
MRYRALKILVTTIVVAAFTVGIFGCAAKETRPQRIKRVPTPTIKKAEPPPPETRAPIYHFHTVRYPGETLSIIAKWYTGKLSNWRILAQANPELDPNRIRPGDRIRIPRGMLKTDQPMPEDYPARFLPKGEKPSEDQPQKLLEDETAGETEEQSPESGDDEDKNAGEPAKSEDSGILFGPKGYEE